MDRYGRFELLAQDNAVPIVALAEGILATTTVVTIAPEHINEIGLV
jgi:hypothetical protein